MEAQPERTSAAELSATTTEPLATRTTHPAMFITVGAIAGSHGPAACAAL